MEPRSLKAVGSLSGCSSTPVMDRSIAPCQSCGVTFFEEVRFVAEFILEYSRITLRKSETFYHVPRATN